MLPYWDVGNVKQTLALSDGWLLFCWFNFDRELELSDFWLLSLLRCCCFCFERELEEISRGEIFHCGHPLVGLVVEHLNHDDDDDAENEWKGWLWWWKIMEVNSGIISIRILSDHQHIFLPSYFIIIIWPEYIDGEAKTDGVKKLIISPSCHDYIIIIPSYHDYIIIIIIL